MSKKIAILQSNYIPWKGYFDIINSVDEFVFYDEVQFTKRDWRNRNRIKTSNGLLWLTIPVITKNRYFQSIKDTRIADRNWWSNHWKSIERNYSASKFFKYYREYFKELYLNSNEVFLCDINYKFIKAINKILNIETKLRWSNEFKLISGKTERLIAICKECKADIYLSGPSAKSYLNLDLIREENLKVEWMCYEGYPEYPQLYPPFVHHVSIIDLVFNVGAQASIYMKSFKKG